MREQSDLFLLPLSVCMKACDRQAGIIVYNDSDRVTSS